MNLPVLITHLYLLLLQRPQKTFAQLPSQLISFTEQTTMTHIMAFTFHQIKVDVRTKFKCG